VSNKEGTYQEEQAATLYSPKKFWELKIYKKLKNKEWQSFYKDYLKFRFDYDLSKLNHASSEEPDHREAYSRANDSSLKEEEVFSLLM
jgi:hypothetical protein